jgi:serine/threonine-protein kinase
MGEVWRCTDVLLRREVAVKVLLPSLVSDAEFIARFRVEARMMAALRHPGIVQVYDYGEEAEVGGDRLDYLVMEYIEGAPLAKWIKSMGRLGVAETISVVSQAAQALHVAHSAGIVHRDVKPSNLLVRPDGVIVLVDFGVARSADITGLTGTNVVLGTAHYMAPEQATGQPVSAETDVYALGAVAYCCLTGRPPFTGDNPLHVVAQHLQGELPALPPEIPAPVAALVARAMAKDPAARYPSAAAFAEAARATQTAGPTAANVPQSAGPVAAGGLPQSAGPASGDGLRRGPGGPPLIAPTIRGNRRRRIVLAGAAGAVVVALAATATAIALLPAEAKSSAQPATPTAVASAPTSGPGPDPAAEAGETAAGGPSRTTKLPKPGAAPTQPTPTATTRPPGESTTTGDPEPPATATTTTAATSPGNPYTAAEVCGSGYKVIDSAALTSGGTSLGKVYLLYHSGTGTNCTVALKSTAVGTATAASTYLEVKGSSRKSDSGSFKYYAGPVRAEAAGICVKWGGSTGGASYNSPFEHCD